MFNLLRKCFNQNIHTQAQVSAIHMHWRSCPKVAVRYTLSFDKAWEYISHQVSELRIKKTND